MARAFFLGDGGDWGDGSAASTEAGYRLLYVRRCRGPLDVKVLLSPSPILKEAHR